MDFVTLVRDVKSTASAGISFHTFITRSLKKSDLTRERVDFFVQLVSMLAFSALTLLVGRQERHLACKKLSGGMLA